MQRWTMIFVLIMLLASGASAGDVVKEFTFKASDGRIIDSTTLKGAPMVIIIGSHW